MAKKPEKQYRQHILQFIAQHQQDTGYPPTDREIMDAVGMTSIGHLHYYLRLLKGEHMLTYVPRRSRTIRLTSHARTLLGLDQGIRVLGTIAAGTPLIIGEAQEFLDPDNFPPGAYALHVHGDSMIDACILDGDYIIVNPQKEPQQGAIIVATHTGEGIVGAATVKTFFHERDYVRLQPANPDYPPIIVPADEWDREWLIQGMVVGVVRRNAGTTAHS